jgi:hypothetical protein
LQTLRIFTFLIITASLFLSTSNYGAEGRVSYPPFDISIPDDAITNISDLNKRKATKVLLLIDMEQLKIIASDFGIAHSPYITKRELIELIVNKTVIADLTREALQAGGTRREITLKKLKSRRQKGLIINNADEVISIQKKYPGGFNRVFIFGHVNIEYQKKIFKGDLIVINIKKKKAKEIMGLGNVSIKEKGMYMVGDKFFYYPPTKKGVIYNPRTYAKPMFIKSKKIRMVDADTFILNDMIASTCDLIYPHYHLSASRTFLYKNDKYVFINVEFKIGQTPFFWSPIFVKSSHGTGIKTALGFERGMGWYVHNTYNLNLKHKADEYKLKFMFDYYQKLGFFSGVEAKIPYTTVKLLGAYDRHVKFVSTGEFTNTFEEVSGEGPVSGHSLRGKMELAFAHDIIKFFNKPMPFSLDLKVNYKDFTDPFFENQFESRRQEIFNFMKIFKSDFTPSSLAPVRGTSGYTGRSADSNLTFKYKNTTLSLLGNWAYRMEKTDNPEYSSNPYRPEYWKNYKNTIIFPNISLATSIEFFDAFYLMGLKKTTTSATSTALQQEENLLESTTEGWKFAWPFTMAPKLTYTRTKSYTFIDGKEELASDTLSKKLVMGVSAPASAEYVYKEIGIKFEIPLQGTYEAWEQITRNPTESQKQSDNANTTNYYSTSLGLAMTFEFFRSYEYLYGKVKFGSTYLQSSKFGKSIVATTDYNRNETLYHTGEVEWFKTNAQVSFGYNYSPGVTNRKGTVALTITSRIVPSVTFSNTYTYDRDDSDGLKGPLTNVMTIQISGFENIRIFKSFFLKKAYFRVTWSKNFRDFRSNSMTWAYGFNFGLSDHTLLTLEVIGQNDKLAAYTGRAADTQFTDANGNAITSRRNIFKDLLDSFNIFNTDARRNSFFKLTGISLSVAHQLHRWKMEFKFTFKNAELADGSKGYVPSIYFIVSLDDLQGVSAPAIRNRYSELGY